MEKEDYENVMLQICSLITESDSEVAAEVQDCLSHTEIYVSEHLEDYNNRDMHLEDDSLEDCQWLGMVDSLINHGYAVEVDWKSSAADFCWNISSLRRFKQLGLSLDKKFSGDDSGIEADDFGDYKDDGDEQYSYEREEESFEEQDVPYWCKYLDNQWFDDDICIGQIDIENDSYVLFITDPDTLEELEDLADMLNRRISSVF